MSHRSAPVEVRERLAFPPCAGRRFLRRLKDEGVVSEAVLLSTCNRTEVYAVVEDEDARPRSLLVGDYKRVFAADDHRLADRAHALAALADGGVGQPDGGERGKPRRHVDFRRVSSAMCRRSA